MYSDRLEGWTDTRLVRKDIVVYEWECLSFDESCAEDSVARRLYEMRRGEGEMHKRAP